MSHMLEIEGLTKRFGTLTAVDGISFSVDRGEVLGFLGPNGAGKTTAMRMVTGFLPATAGRALVEGFDVAVDPIAVKKRIGYLPEGAPLYEDMTPLELLDFVANVRGLGGAAKGRAIDQAADRINIRHVLRQSIGTLSKGYKRRVGIAQAILHDPDVLILDEPTDGLDPNQKHEVRRLINDMAENKVIVISTHLLEEVEMVCTRAIVISRGRIVADGTPAELEARSRHHNAVVIRLPGGQAEACRGRLSAIEGVSSVEVTGNGGGAAQVVVFSQSGAVIIEQVSAELRSGDFQVDELRVERGRLDDVFREITTAA